jgi:hypothetical protein
MNNIRDQYSKIPSIPNSDLHAGRPLRTGQRRAIEPGAT